MKNRYETVIQKWQASGIRIQPFSRQGSYSLRFSCTIVFFLKPGIHLRQRQTEAQCGSLSSASVDGATNRATCLRGCHDPSHRLSVDQSEASLRNFPPQAQYGQNMPCLTETEKYSVVRGAPRMPCHASACLSL